MPKDEPGYKALTFRRGETRAVPFTYGPRDKTLPRYDLTGKSVSMRIQPDGAAEIVYTDVNPGCYISNTVGGEITINPTGAMVTAYDFLNAPYVVLLDGKRIMRGELTIKSLYE